MNLTDNEKRFAYQIESTDQIGMLHVLTKLKGIGFIMSRCQEMLDEC